MSGTAEGGAKAQATNKKKFGEDYYAKIGALGGTRSRTGGFYVNRELAREVGAKGGQKGRRGPTRKLPKVEVKPEDLGLRYCDLCSITHFVKDWPHENRAGMRES